MKLHYIGPIACLAALWLCNCSSPPNQLSRDAADGRLVDARSKNPQADAALADAALVDAAAHIITIDAAPVPDALVSVDASNLDANQANPLNISLVDVTTQVGIFGAGDTDAWATGGGAAIGDVDGDGNLDVVLARCSVTGTLMPSLLLRQNAVNPTFNQLVSDATFSAMFDNTCAHSVAFGDYDADGDLDLFVGMRGPDRLLQNDGSGHFTDVAIGLQMTGAIQGVTTGAVWADVNSDGLLDLYVISYSMTSPPTAHPANANRLYINQGDATFREVAASAGAAGNGFSQAALIADLDNDGDLEIYVANDRFALNGSNPNTALQPDSYLDATSFNDRGDPAYANQSQLFGMDGPRSAMGIGLSDLNGDGVQDIYVSDWGANHLHVSNGVGGYDEDAAAWNLDLALNPFGYSYISWGARFVDFDRNGREELLIVNGAVSPATNCFTWLQLDLFLRRSDTADTFSDITAAVGWPSVYECTHHGFPYSGRGAVIGDLDGDGDDDVIITPYAETFRFYRNDSQSIGRQWLRVRPKSTVSAPTPVGLVLEVQTTSGKTFRKMLYAGGDPRSHSAGVVEVGLTGDSTVTRAVLRWPSGIVQRIDQLAGFSLNSELAVTEPTWLQITKRVVNATETPAKLILFALNEDGSHTGSAGSGKTVTATRSDGVAVNFTDLGNGTYKAIAPHPGTARITVFTIAVDGVTQRHRPTINYK